MKVSLKVSLDLPSPLPVANLLNRCHQKESAGMRFDGGGERRKNGLEHRRKKMEEVEEWKGRSRGVGIK